MKFKTLNGAGEYVTSFRVYIRVKEFRSCCGFVFNKVFKLLRNFKQESDFSRLTF